MNRRIALGDVIADRFRLVADIGRGGMGHVFEAVDLKHDRQAAIKVIYRQLAEDPEFRARFQREAQAAERANHPHVLPVWDYGTAAGHLYLATPLCDTDLAGMLADSGRVEPETAIAIMSQIAWALDWAHGRDVVHRDVKDGEGDVERDPDPGRRPGGAVARVRGAGAVERRPGRPRHGPVRAGGHALLLPGRPPA